MALEDTLKDLYKKRIDSSKSYDRDYWVDKFDDFQDLEKYLSRFKEDPNNPDNLNDLGKLLHRNPQFYNNFSNPGSIITIEGDAAYKTWADAMARYIQNNMDDFFDLLEDDDWVNLITNIKLYKKDEDDYHDRFVEAKWEFDKVREASSSNDFSKISDYVKSKLDEVPEWLKTSINYLGGNREYMSALFEGFAGFAQNKFFGELYVKNGEETRVDRSKLQAIIEGSFDEVWEHHNNEEDKGDQSDIWEADIRSNCLLLGRVVFPKEEEEKYWDEDEDEQERRAERKAAGLTQ